ncbi:phage tail protein [Salmonella enterica]
MPQTTITSAFNRLKAQEAAGGRRIILDEFVFANIPGLDPATLPDEGAGLPDPAHIVHRQYVDRAGMVNSDTVVYSVTLPSNAGNFTFNWMALINKESGTVAVITHLEPQQKIKNADGVQGNVLNYSEYMRYKGASALTGITTLASTWQIDFSARLHGMDEATRKVARDLYGKALFFGDAFRLTATLTPGLADLAPGTAYLRGLRTELDAAATLTFETGKEQTVCLDSVLSGSLTGENRTTFALITHTTEDYTDALGFRHFVEPIAHIAPDGTITDLRTVGAKVRDVLAGEFLEKHKNLSEIADNGADAQKEARRHLGLGKLAVLDSIITDDGSAMKKAANGSDIENVAAFRSSLQLGDSATRNVGKLPGTVAAGNDSRITGAMQKDQNGADIPDKPLFVRTLGIVDAYPAGCPIPYPGRTAPDGYLMMDGRAFSKALYPQLAALYADGVLPDMRGMYVRGWDNGRGLDIPRGYDSYNTLDQMGENSVRGYEITYNRRYEEGVRSLLAPQYFDALMMNSRWLWRELKTTVNTINETPSYMLPEGAFNRIISYFFRGAGAGLSYLRSSYSGDYYEPIDDYDESRFGIVRVGSPNIAFNYITKAA